MSMPACGAWVNWVSTCPPPRPSTQTPSVGKSKTEGAHCSGCNSSLLLSAFIFHYIYNVHVQNTVL